MKLNLRYWLCQIVGWGGWTILNIFFAYQFAYKMYFAPPDKGRLFLIDMAVEFAWAILATHLLRLALKKIQWIRFPNRKIIILFISGIFVTALLSYYGPRVTAMITNTSLIEYEKKDALKSAIVREKELNVAGTDYYLSKPTNSLKPDTSKSALNALAAISIKKNTGWYRNTNGQWQYEDQRKGRFWWEIIFTFILSALWVLLYMVWHFVEKNRNDQVDRLTLEKTVKELEVKTIKSHINPHFIFNSLNSIRALVDENPERARKAITELSNILRSSMQV
ncbi:MAG: histidine kinase, partial [Ginsengibacter sp.]